MSANLKIKIYKNQKYMKICYLKLNNYIKKHILAHIVQQFVNIIRQIPQQLPK